MNKTFAFAEVKDVKDSTDPNGEFEAILSAPTLDRDLEIIDAGAFAPLPDHITIDTDHGMSTATTVASGTPVYDGDILRFKGTYSSIPRAQEVRTLVKEGHIRTMSVAFMSANRETGEDGITHITRAELLNAAFVSVPSNRDAAVLVGKSLDADRDALQKMHDLAVTNGASCKHAHGDTNNSIADPEPASAESAAATAPPLRGTATARALALAAEAALI